jgi:hypothetical protein
MIMTTSSEVDPEQGDNSFKATSSDRRASTASLVPATGDDGAAKAPHLTPTVESLSEDIFANESYPETANSTLALVLKIVGSIIAPTTLLTALLFYFGVLHAYWFLQYFGVNYTIMGFTAQDYLLRSADGLFVPLTVIAGTALVTVWGYQLVHDRLSARARLKAQRTLLPFTAVVGLVLVCVALTGVIDPEALRAYIAIPGLSLAIGVLLLALTLRLRRSFPATRKSEATLSAMSAVIVGIEWGAIFLLVSIGLFWSVGDYSAAVGTARGRDVQAALSAWPDAMVYSAQSLNLRGRGVREVQCNSPAGAYRFRYDGLKLVLQSNGQYFFLPSGWTTTQGVAIVIPRSDSLRLEFAAPRVAAIALGDKC